MSSISIRDGIACGAFAYGGRIMCNLIAIIVPVISGTRLLKWRCFRVRMQRTCFGLRRPVAATAAADFRFYFMLVALERVVLVVIHLIVVKSPIVP